jgi:hypothetical protein
MFTDFVTPFWNGTVGHTLQVGIARTVDEIRN